MSPVGVSSGTNTAESTDLQRAPRFVARVLGGFAVTVGGRTIARPEWQRASAERLVKLLLVTRGHRLTREVAAEILWPDAGPQASGANLRKALHYATQALGRDGALVSLNGALAIDGEMLELDLDTLEEAFEVLARADPGADPRATAAALDVVLELGPRDLLPDDLYEDWLVGPRERLRSRWQQIALRAARRAANARRPDDAHAILAELLARDPTDEAAHRLAMELYATEGRHHAARRQFEACREALRAYLDTEPSAETTQLAERLSAVRTIQTAAEPPLVARHSEMVRIEPLLDRVAAGQFASLVLHGPAGIGKSRLMSEVVAYSRAAGWQVVAWQAIESGRRLDYAPLRVVLAGALEPSVVSQWREPARSAIAAIAPALAPERAIRFESRDALAAGLVDALAEAASTSPLVLAIDDVPWLDDASIDLLGAASAGLRSSPILLALTHRDDEPVAPRAELLLDALSRAGGLDIELGPLQPRDLEQLVVGHLGGRALQPELAAALYEQSFGNPLVCLGLMASERDRGGVRLADGRWCMGAAMRWNPPRSIRTLIARRVEQLPAPVREVLAIVAALGNDASFETLAAVVRGDGTALIEALDGALDWGLLVERGAGYAFAHPLYRVAFEGALGEGRRAATHLAIARALAGAATDDTAIQLEAIAAASVDPVRVAEHALTAAELGACGAAPLAVSFGFAAGARSLALFNRGQGRAYMERAIAVYRQLKRSEAERFNASGAFVTLGDSHMDSGDDESASRCFRSAITAARTPEELALAYAHYHWVPYRHGDFYGALALIDEGLGRLPRDASVARAQLGRAKGWVLARQGQTSEAIRVLEDVTPVLEASANRHEAMVALDALGDLYGMMGRHDEAIAMLNRSLSVAVAICDSRGESRAHLHLCGALTDAGRPVQARPHGTRGIEAARLCGARYEEAVASWMAASADDELGDLDAAAAHRRHELELLESIGGNARHQALAHAHLASIARRRNDAETAASEANVARRLAAAHGDAAYSEAIERSFTTERWAVRPR